MSFRGVTVDHPELFAVYEVSDFLFVLPLFMYNQARPLSAFVTVSLWRSSFFFMPFIFHHLCLRFYVIII
jgi:hypothetical protein